MTQYDNGDQTPRSKIHLFIGEEEWKNYSYENKLRLLYRLKQSQSSLAKELDQSLSLIIEEEQLKKEIDFEATLKKIKESDN